MRKMLEPWQVIGSKTTYEDAWLKVQSDCPRGSALRAIAA